MSQKGEFYHSATYVPTSPYDQQNMMGHFQYHKPNVNHENGCPPVQTTVAGRRSSPIDNYGLDRPCQRMQNHPMQCLNSPALARKEQDMYLAARRDVKSTYESPRGNFVPPCISNGVEFHMRPPLRKSVLCGNHPNLYNQRPMIGQQVVSYHPTNQRSSLATKLPMPYLHPRRDESPYNRYLPPTPHIELQQYQPAPFTAIAPANGMKALWNPHNNYRSELLVPTSSQINYNKLTRPERIQYEPLRAPLEKNLRRSVAGEENAFMNIANKTKEWISNWIAKGQTFPGADRYLQNAPPENRSEANDSNLHKQHQSIGRSSTLSPLSPINYSKDLANGKRKANSQSPLGRLVPLSGYFVDRNAKNFNGLSLPFHLDQGRQSFIGNTEKISSTRINRATLQQAHCAKRGAAIPSPQHVWAPTDQNSSVVTNPSNQNNGIQSSTSIDDPISDQAIHPTMHVSKQLHNHFQGPCHQKQSLGTTQLHTQRIIHHDSNKELDCNLQQNSNYDGMYHSPQQTVPHLSEVSHRTENDAMSRSPLQATPSLQNERRLAFYGNYRQQPRYLQPNHYRLSLIEKQDGHNPSIKARSKSPFRSEVANTSNESVRRTSRTFGSGQKLLKAFDRSMSSSAQGNLSIDHALAEGVDVHVKQTVAKPEAIICPEPCARPLPANKACCSSLPKFGGPKCCEYVGDKPPLLHINKATFEKGPTDKAKSKPDSSNLLRKENMHVRSDEQIRNEIVSLQAALKESPATDCLQPIINEMLAILNTEIKPAVKDGHTKKVDLSKPEMALYASKVPPAPAPYEVECVSFVTSPRRMDNTNSLAGCCQAIRHHDFLRVRPRVSHAPTLEATSIHLPASTISASSTISFGLRHGGEKPRTSETDADSWKRCAKSVAPIVDLCPRDGIPSIQTRTSNSLQPSSNNLKFSDNHLCHSHPNSAQNDLDRKHYTTGDWQDDSNNGIPAHRRLMRPRRRKIVKVARSRSLLAKSLDMSAAGENCMNRQAQLSPQRMGQKAIQQPEGSKSSEGPYNHEDGLLQSCKKQTKFQGVAAKSNDNAVDGYFEDRIDFPRPTIHSATGGTLKSHSSSRFEELIHSEEMVKLQSAGDKELKTSDSTTPWELSSIHRGFSESSYVSSFSSSISSNTSNSSRSLTHHCINRGTEIISSHTSGFCEERFDNTEVTSRSSKNSSNNNNNNNNNAQDLQGQKFDEQALSKNLELQNFRNDVSTTSDGSEDYPTLYQNSSISHVATESENDIERDNPFEEEEVRSTIERCNKTQIEKDHLFFRLTGSTERIPFDNFHEYEDSIDILMKGASGTVFSGVYKGVEVAVKVPNDKALEAAPLSTLKRFIQEWDLMAKCQHPRIVSFLGGLIDGDGDIFLVMERTDGPDFHTMRYVENYSPVALDALRMCYGLSCGIEYLHQPDPATGKSIIVHRDLKPENLLVQDEVNICICDFGDSQELIEGCETRLLGTTWMYAPIEVLRFENGGPKAEVLPAWDIWAAGCLFQEMLGGHHPLKHYVKGNASAEETVTILTKLLDEDKFHPMVCPDFPMPIQLMIQQCFNPDPRQRPSASELKTFWRMLLDHEEARLY